MKKNNKAGWGWFAFVALLGEVVAVGVDKLQGHCDLAQNIWVHNSPIAFGLAAGFTLGADLSDEWTEKPTTASVLMWGTAMAGVVAGQVASQTMFAQKAQENKAVIFALPQAPVNPFTQTAEEIVTAHPKTVTYHQALATFTPQ